MATLYWVSSGGAGNWSSGSNWSLSSGGAPAFAVPGPGDSVVFDTNSGNNCTFDVNPTVVDFSFVGNCQNVSFNTSISATLTVKNNLDLSGGYFLTSQTFSTLSNLDIVMTAVTSSSVNAIMSANGVYRLTINCASSSSTVTLGGQAGSTSAKVRTLFLTQGYLSLSTSYAPVGFFDFGDQNPSPPSFGGISASSNLFRAFVCYSADVRIRCFGNIDFGTTFNNYIFSLTNRSSITFMGAATNCSITFPKKSSFSVTNMPIIENRLSFSPDSISSYGPSGPRNVIFTGSNSPVNVENLSFAAYVKCVPANSLFYKRGILFPASGTVTFTGTSLSGVEKPLDVSGDILGGTVRLGSSDAYQATLSFTSSAASIVTSLSYAEISYINSATPYKIYALTTNNNVDNGNNTNVIFQNTGSGFFTVLF
jgi:hypothetical protein